jgi:hydrogenase maturation protease HycI
MIMPKLPPGRLVVVGIGNALRADDAAGSMVAQRLMPRFPGLVFDAGQAPENFVAPVRRARPDVVLLVDAADFGGSAGEVRAAAAADVAGSMVGTHAAPLSMFMDVLERETGAKITLLAVQAARTALGAEPSPEVTDSVARLAKQLGRELYRRSSDETQGEDP